MVLNKVLLDDDNLLVKESASLEENSTGMLDILEEMANFKKPDTGLPVNIWLGTGKTYIRGGHRKRIKFQNDYGNNTNWSNLLSMTLSKDNLEIPKNDLPKVKITAKDIEKIKKFIVINYRLLDKLADEKITIVMFIKQMKTV